MGGPYSMDLREQVIAALEGGVSTRQGMSDLFRFFRRPHRIGREPMFAHLEKHPAARLADGA